MLKHASNNRRYIITKNLILMLVMLVVIFLASFAWFQSNPTASASGLSVKAKAAGGVELALPYQGSYPDGVGVPAASKFSDSIEFENSGFVKGMFKDVTSDGKRFLIPTFESEKNLTQGEKLKQGRKVLTDGTWTRAESSMELLSNDKEEDDNQYHYIALDFYVKSSNPDIKIREGSYLATGSEKEAIPKRLSKDSGNSSVYRESTDGNGTFSADGLAGAIRVSILSAEVKGQQAVANSQDKEDIYMDHSASPASQTPYWEQAKSCGLVWLPRPDMFLETAETSGDWRLKTGSVFVNGGFFSREKTNHHFFYGAKDTGTIKYDNETHLEISGKGVERNEFIQNDVNTPSYFIATEYDSTAVAQNNASYTPTLQTPKTISDYSDNMVTFTEEDPQDNNSTITKQMYLYKYRLNIWIEGADAEARRAMDKGEFQLYMIFGN